MTKITLMSLLILVSCCSLMAQQTENLIERRVALTEPAIALDKGVTALEATLRTMALHGAPDTPVTNVRLVIRNAGTIPYSYLSGLVTFYDGAGVRCGEGIFKADMLAVNESFETDTPGIRVSCSPATWRIVAADLLPRISPGPAEGINTARPGNLIISVDGQAYPIQLDRPLVLRLGERQRTLIVSQVP